MDKELIKQLGSIGFEYTSKDSICMQLKIGLNYIFALHHRTGGDIFFCYFEKEYIHNQEPIKNPTFPQILAAIKEHTGVDLKKKTKREEIEELKTKVESLEDAIKSQNEAIEELNISIKARGRICSQDTFKQEEKTKEKKAFKVGDRVVNNGDSNSFCNGSVLEVIGSYPFNNSFLCKSTQGHKLTDFVLAGDLEHAPKEQKEKALELGDWAKTLVGKVNIPKGSKVLIVLHLDTDNDFYCSTGQSDDHFEYYKPEELKPL